VTLKYAVSVIEQLQPASFRKVSFLVNSETKAGGKKTVSHEYVNNDKRFTEELGLLPPRFTIDAIISGSDAISRRFDLENALDKPGLATLVHPIYGSVQVKSTTYSVSSNQTRIGEYRFSINFETSEAVVTPTITTVTASAAENAADTNRANINDTFEGDYQAPTLPEELTETANKATEIFEDVKAAIIGVTGTIEEKVSDFTRVVDDAIADVFTIVQTAEGLKDTLEAVYSTALDVANTPVELADAWEGLLDFGFLDVKRDLSTVSRLISEGNKVLLNEHTRLTALTNLYEALVFKDFQTEPELDADRKLLNDSYQRLLKEYTEDIDTENLSNIASDQDIQTSFAELRVLAGKIFNQVEQNIWRVVDISPGKTSMALTVYRYYGNLDNLSLLQSLNPDVNHARFNQDIQAVSQ
jgi:prophage DNA circulation protein